MKKILLIFCLLFSTVNTFAQQFSQYNTGTLYDSFENPAQRSFIPDSSHRFASNFLIPNINLNYFLSGDAQGTIKGRIFLKNYNNSLLLINKGKDNISNGDINLYLVTFKAYTNLDGDEEMGFSFQIKAEGKMAFTDETAAILGGIQNFNDEYYPSIFNSSYYYQAYHQISFAYRRKVNRQFAFGFKISSLLGIQYKGVNITSSRTTFDKADDAVYLGLTGTYYNSYLPNYQLTSNALIPSFKNPGAAISIGTAYRSNDGFILQGNVKDLGFIHWNNQSQVFNFDNSEVIHGASSPQWQDSVFKHVNSIIHNTLTNKSFTTPVDGRAELSINKAFWLNYDNTVKYLPTLIASKELFYPGFIGALVNSVQYKNCSIALTTTYDDLKTFTLGAQFMYKTPDVEFYIGSDKLTQSIAIAADEINKNPASIYQNNSFTGASFFMGIAFKFGALIEHPMNGSENGF
ncbi:MAG: hypothetical protein JWR12_874 [Mucilaginibacter sp.]|nr:hypothetical protein [Mucilaginibacter sp.]